MVKIKELIENQNKWKVKVMKGTKAIPNGDYQLYVRTIKNINSISFKTALNLIEKGKAELITERGAN